MKSKQQHRSWTKTRLDIQMSCCIRGAKVRPGASSGGQNFSRCHRKACTLPEGLSDTLAKPLQVPFLATRAIAVRFQPNDSNERECDDRQANFPIY